MMIYISHRAIFMGAVVSIPAKTMPVGVTKHLIIDGQQRLTTVSLLLCALRDALGERKISADSRLPCESTL